MKNSGLQPGGEGWGQDGRRVSASMTASSQNDMAFSRALVASAWAARISGETEVVTLVIQCVTKNSIFFIESLEPLTARVAA